MHHSGQESVRVIDGVEEILAERGGFSHTVLANPRSASVHHCLHLNTTSTFLGNFGKFKGFWLKFQPALSSIVHLLPLFCYPMIFSIRVELT